MKKTVILLIVWIITITTSLAADVVYLNLDGEIVDQSYTTQNLYAEMYAPETPNGISVLIYPGGAYAWKGMTYEGSDFAPFFNNLGITIFVVSYALPNGVAKAPLESCERFMRAVKAKSATWNLDPEKIGVMGSSAGGHLATTHATHFSNDTRPAFQILLYPVVSMKSGLTHDGSRTALLGNTPGEHDIHYYSNELQVKDNTPKAYIALSEDDAVVPVDNSILYYKACIDHGIPAELQIYPSGGHGWGYNDFAYRTVFLSTLRSWLKTNVLNGNL